MSKFLEVCVTLLGILGLFCVGFGVTGWLLEIGRSLTSAGRCILIGIVLLCGAGISLWLLGIREGW